MKKKLRCTDKSILESAISDCVYAIDENGNTLTE